MSIDQAVLEVLHKLPPERQREVLDFAEYVASKENGKRPRRSVKGLCADLGVSISAEEIDEARREMWGRFPREDI